MVYIYICKRFKVTMEMISSREADWVNNLLQSYCKHSRVQAKLERAEINPKSRMCTNVYDSSSDVFTIDLVYKDTTGTEHELKWVIKVTRSDINEMADRLLRHEKMVFSRLLTDLIDAVKQRGAGRLAEARVSFADIICLPEYIFEETQAQANVLRNVLVIDNLEEKMFFPVQSDQVLNLCHLRVVVKTVAKFHAISLLYKKVMFDVFRTQSAQAAAKKTIDDVEIEGENRVPTERFGLFARFPFLTQRQETMTHLISNRHKFLDMYQRILECFPGESHLLDTFEYLRLSIDQVLQLDEDIQSHEYPEHPLDSIALGILEIKSFLFFYSADETNAKDPQKKKSVTKLQRSQSERSKDRTAYQAHQAADDHTKHKADTKAKCVATSKCCAKLEKQLSLSGCKINNRFLQNVVGMSKDDNQVRLSNAKKNPCPNHDINSVPKKAALINAKYVTYTRLTRDLAVIFFTCADYLVRRYYLIKLLQCYSETLGITLGQLGIDTESYGVNYMAILCDFQQHLLYGFFVGVLLAMANTNPDDLERFVASKQHHRQQQFGFHVQQADNRTAATEGQPAAASASSSGGTEDSSSGKYIALTDKRVEFLIHMIRDVASYVESKDFELGLPITNFARYHELWSMQFSTEEEDNDDDDDDDDDGETESQIEPEKPEKSDEEEDEEEEEVDEEGE